MVFVEFCQLSKRILADDVGIQNEKGSVVFEQYFFG
jgi:hypothetical protein